MLKCLYKIIAAVFMECYEFNDIYLLQSIIRKKVYGLFLHCNCYPLPLNKTLIGEKYMKSAKYAISVLILTQKDDPSNMFNWNKKYENGLRIVMPPL